MTKIQKGEAGYLPYQTKKAIVKTIVYFAVSILIYAFGYYQTKSKANLFTIIAVFDLLPSSRSLVSMIMYLRIPKYPTLNLNIPKDSTVHFLYELYLTSYKKNFPINIVAVKGAHIIGLCLFEKCDIKACEEHIDEYAKKNSLGSLTIKIFDNERAFTERVTQLSNLEESRKDTEIVKLLGELSL